MKNKPLALGLLTVAIAGLASCGGHTHSFTINNHDDSQHWVECECGEKNEVASHNYTDYGSDDTGHWTICSCGATTEKEEHEFDAGTYLEGDEPSNDVEGAITYTCEVCGTEERSALQWCAKTIIENYVKVFFDATPTLGTNYFTTTLSSGVSVYYTGASFGAPSEKVTEEAVCKYLAGKVVEGANCAIPSAYSDEDGAWEAMYIYGMQVIAITAYTTQNQAGETVVAGQVLSYCAYHLYA